MTKEEFKEHFWSINPSGDFNATFNVLNFHVQNFPDTNGKSLTFEYIHNKYKEYFEYHSTKFKNVEEKYISKADKLKDIYSFIDGFMYNLEFNVIISFPERDEYLFGKHKLDNLYKKYEEFTKRIAALKRG